MGRVTLPKDIRPFNDVFYINCVYPSILTGVKYWGGDILPFLPNDFFSYKADGAKLYVKRLHQKGIEDVLSGMGIFLEPIAETEDILVEMKKSICGGFPILLTVDRYYWSQDVYNLFYKKLHMPHGFLVYGYDDDMCSLLVVDTNDDGKGCYLNTFLYEDFENSFSKGMEHCNLSAKRMVGKQEHKKLSKEIYRNEYIKNYQFLCPAIKDEMRHILDVITSYEDGSVDELLRDNPVESTLPFGGLERGKLTQYYQIHQLFGYDDKIMQILKCEVEIFYKIKALLIKVAYTKKIDERIRNSIAQKYRNIYDLDTEFHSLISQRLEIEKC